MTRIFGIMWLLIISTASNAQSTVTAYNTFLDFPQRAGQQVGFGYYGGLQVTDTIFGVSFVPTISGDLANVWIGVGTALSDVGTDLINLYLATSGPNLEPDTIFAEAEIQGELAKGESIVSIPADESGIFIQEGVLYWLLIQPGVGTPQVGWLGGPPNGLPGVYSAYLNENSPTGWLVSTINANGAFRIDVTAVTPVSEPNAYALMIAGIGLIGMSIRRRKNI